MSSNLGTVGTISSFQRKNYEAFYWKIDQLSALNGTCNSFYRSPDFHFKTQRNNYLRFYPDGSNNKSGSFELYLISTVYTSCSVYLTLCLKTQSGRIEKLFSKYTIFPHSGEIGSALIKRTDFFKRKEDLAPSDSVTFVVFLSSDVLEIIRDVADRTKTTGAEAKKGEEESEKKGGEKVLEDMTKLLASGDKSDALIVVEDSEFRVHSCILSARTPVFAALFEHDTLEKSTRKITITDCEPDIFEEFLHYIYSGSVRNLTSENSLDLYRVSDKYLVNELKDVSRQCIQDNLCPETFCEAV